MKIKSREDIRKDWESGEFAAAYFFPGEESFLKEDLASLLTVKFSASQFDYFVHDGESSEMQSVIMDADTPPVSNSRRIIILKRAHKIKAAPLKGLLSYLNDPYPTTTLVILYDKFLKNNEALYNELAGLKTVFCEFNPLSPEQALSYSRIKFSRLSAANKNKSSISDQALELLISITGTDTARLSMELDKLLLYKKGSEVITSDDVIESCGTAKSENPFEIINAIISRDGKRMAELIKNLFREKTEPLAIIYMINGALSKILKINTLYASGLDSRLAYSLGIFRSEMNRAPSLKNLDRKRIINLLNKGMEAEYLLKSSSGRNPELVVKNLAYEINRALSLK